MKKKKEKERLGEEMMGGKRRSVRNEHSRVVVRKKGRTCVIQLDRGSVQRTHLWSEDRGVQAVSERLVVRILLICRHGCTSSAGLCPNCHA